MPQPDPILESLGLFTHWPVQRMMNGYRLRFNYDDLIHKAISGIEFGFGASSKDAFCPRLNTSEFDHVPILFEMVQNDLNDPILTSEVHYYTLGGKLHRVGAPAKYTMRPIQTLTVEMVYLRHGIVHRDDGPAKITYHGITSNPLRDQYGNEVDGGFEATIESSKYQWLIDNEECIYPNPNRAELEDIRLLYDELGRLHDFEGEAALTAGTSRWTWTSRGETESTLLPVSIQIDSLQETYQEGTCTGRQGIFVESAWVRGSDAPKVMEEFPPAYVIDQINLWTGPFFKTASAAMRLEGEYTEKISQ